MVAEETKPKLGCFANLFGVKIRSSRWRKASKCKHHIENLLSSIKIHRSRRETMVRQSRSDIAQLLPNGRLSEALPKAKQFYEDERKISAYDQVEYFCTHILQNFPTLDQSDVHLLPEETKEAMAGMVFAASRIGELRELQDIRSLFVQRFGFEFDKDCVDLRPGNVVNMEIVKALDLNMSQDVISPEMVIGNSQKYRTDSATSVDTREDSVKENSRFLHSNLGETRGRDRSSYMR